jgi:hypothetical protein
MDLEGDSRMVGVASKDLAGSRRDLEVDSQVVLEVDNQVVLGLEDLVPDTDLQSLVPEDLEVGNQVVLVLVVVESRFVVLVVVEIRLVVLVQVFVYLSVPLDCPFLLHHQNLQAKARLQLHQPIDLCLVSLNCTTEPFLFPFAIPSIQ